MDESTQPITTGDAVRPLSVGLFLTVFVPSVTLVATGLFVLLTRSSDASATLQVLEVKTGHVEELLRDLSEDTKTIRETRLREIGDRLNELTAEVKTLEQRRK